MFFSLFSMAKRKLPGFTSEFKKKISRLVAEKSSDVKFEDFKGMFKEQGFKTIWVKEEENFKKQDGYLFCDNQLCRHRKITDRVSFKLVICPLIA